METPQARRKAREAHFFLDNMARAEQARSNPEHFSFYLSAFLSAAKSVAAVAQYELRHGRYFQEWKDTLSEKDRACFREMTEFRDVEVHEDGAPFGHPAAGRFGKRHPPYIA